MEFSINVKQNTEVSYYGVLVSGFDYETDSYNPWTRNIKFNSVGEAIEFKRELDLLVFDDEGHYGLSDNEHTPLIQKIFGRPWAYLTARDSYDIYFVEAKATTLNDNEIRKHLIQDWLVSEPDAPYPS